MNRVYNFSAGPAILPEEVLKEAQNEMLDYKGSGMSVMEMSHRSTVFQNILEDAENDLRELLNIPTTYHVLFLQGGTSLQFSMIPINFLKTGTADYIVTGEWAEKAYKEAKKYGDINLAASSSNKQYSYIPAQTDLSLQRHSDYVYICENNTIYGTKYPYIPETNGIPLISDVSSCFLSEPMDVTKYSMIYGGVQKNIGPAGVVIAIIRNDLVPDSVNDYVPTMMQYHTHIQHNSLYNTPPCYNIYICGKIFKWLKQIGGLEAIQKRNILKAGLLYDYLDHNNLFHGTAERSSRSLMNVPFTTGNKNLDAQFISEAEKSGLVNLKGHRIVGGMRASIYNAMPVAGVKALIEFMYQFEKTHLN